MLEYFLKLEKWKKMNQILNLEFYVRGKRYITDSIQGGVVKLNVSEQIRDLAKTLVEKNPKLPIWISIERQ